MTRRSVIILVLIFIAVFVAALLYLSPFGSLVGARLARPAVGTVYKVQASGYASSPYQTDSTPCITAAGTRVRPGVVASNFLPMGTIITYNDSLYIVEDRMNSRYQGHFLDIWFPSTAEALIFGRRNINISISGYGTPGQALIADEKGIVREPSIWKRANLRFIALSRLTSQSVLTAVSPGAYDQDCSSTE